MGLLERYRPGFFIVCPHCFKVGRREPVQQLLDEGNVLYCHNCGVLPFLYDWPVEWGQSWCQFGVIPGDKQWVDGGHDPSSTNGFPVVMPTNVHEKVGRDLENIIQNCPEFFCLCPRCLPDRKTALNGCEGDGFSCEIHGKIPSEEYLDLMASDPDSFVSRIRAALD